MKKSLILACLCTLAVSFAHAQVMVEDAWSRATVAQQRASGAFMTLTAERDMKLVDIESDAANVVEIHEMRMDGDVMRMRAISALDLPAGTAVELKPGGFHVMLIDLAEPLEEGAHVELRLTFEDSDGTRSEQRVSAQVRALTHRHGAPAAGHERHQHSGGGGEQCHHHEDEAGKHGGNDAGAGHHHGHDRH